MGLKQATGDYITFVDADDWIAPNMYESLFNLLTENKADLAICGRTRVTADGKEIHYPHTSIQHFYDGKIDMKRLSCQFDLNILMNKLYSRKLLEDLQLPENMSYAEDLYVAPDILNRSKHAVYTSEGYYYYRENLSSASFHLTEEKLQSDIIAKEKFYRFMKSKKVNTSIAFDFLFGAYARGYEQGKSKKEFRKKYSRFYWHNLSACLFKLKCLIFLLSPTLYFKLKK